MKRIVLCILSLLICSSLIGCSSSKSSEQIEANLEVKDDHVEKQESVVIKDDIYKIIDSFISSYNEATDVEIVDTTEIDITDKNGEYYRTEFRLLAFQDAPAKQGSVGNSTIQIINYGSLNLSGLRIYVSSESKEELKDIFVTAALLFDDSITSDEIEKAFSKYDLGGSFLLGENLTGVINGFGENCEFMLDDSRYIKHKAE